MDFEGPEKIKEEVLKKLLNISMFLVEDMRDLDVNVRGMQDGG